MPERLNSNPQNELTEGAHQALEGIFAQIDGDTELDRNEERWLKGALKKLEKKNPALLPQIEERFKVNKELTSLQNAILANIPENKRGKISRLNNKKNTFYETIVAELQGQPDKSLEKYAKKTVIDAPQTIDANQCNKGDRIENLDFSTEALERSTGLADLLPAAVRTINVYDENGSLLGKAVRTSYAGNFYHDGNKYAVIWDGYSIEITETIDEAVVAKKSADFKTKFPKINFANIEHAEASEKAILYAEALNYGIDPALLLSLRKTENGAPGREMGILTSKTVDFRDQARLAARSIENSSHRFTEKYQDRQPAVLFWQSSGVISAEGLAFCSSRYCTDGSEHARLWAGVYQRIGGVNLTISDEIKKEFVDNSARMLDEGNYSVNSKGEISAGIERSSSGTTLCSRTARRLLLKFAGIIAPSGESAHASMEMNLPLQTTLPNTGENCLDIYVQSNSKFGHRAFGYKYEGEWVVVDPYRNAPNGVPFEEYSRRNSVIGFKPHTAQTDSFLKNPIEQIA